MLKEVPESLANSIIESYFSKDGIENSIERIPIAGTYDVRIKSDDNKQN
jgi:hypothetical protein